MTKYVVLISLIFALLFYILTLLLINSKIKSYFTINYIVGYVLMLSNFLFMSQRLMKIVKVGKFSYDLIFRLAGFCLLLFFWINYGKLNIVGLITGFIAFTISLPISALIYTKLGENNGTPH